MDILVPDWTILIDQREKSPWTFKGLTGKKGGKEVKVVPKTEKVHIKTGDYTIKGYEDSLFIERKSKEDLYSTVGQNRDRFERELVRMSNAATNGGYAAIVVESAWRDTFHEPPERSSLNPASLEASLLAWSMRYNIHLIYRPGKFWAERAAYQIMNRFWRDRNEG